MHLLNSNRTQRSLSGPSRRRQLRHVLSEAVSLDAAADEAPKAWQPVMDYTAAALLLCNVHRNTFSVLLPQISNALLLSPSQAGQIQAANLLAYLIGQLPAGTAADKLGGTSVLVAALLLWSAATAMTAIPCLTAAADSAAAATGGGLLSLLILICARGLMGLASAAAMPCVTAISAQQVPAADRGSAVSSVYASFNLGGVLGLALIPPLALAVGVPGAFIITGGLGVAWAVYGYLTLPQGTTLLAAAAAATKPKRRHKVAASEPAEGSSQAWRLPSGAVLQQMAVLCYAHAVMGYGFFILQNWIPMYLSSVGGQNLAVTGGLSSIPWLAAAAVGPAAGRAADTLIKSGIATLSVRRLMQNLCFLGCAASVVPLALVSQPSMVLAVLCLTASLAFYSFSHSGFHSYLQDVAASNAGVVYAITNTCSIAVGVVGNLVTGMVVEATGSYSSVFVLFAVLYLSAALLFTFFTNMSRVQF